MTFLVYFSSQENKPYRDTQNTFSKICIFQQQKMERHASKQEGESIQRIKKKGQKLPVRGPDITLKQVRRQIRYYKHIQRTKGSHV